MEKIRLLLVDDHAVLRDALRALLNIYDDIEIVGEASDGSEALEKLKQVHPDVVVMDLGMPKLDGFEATRRIKKRYPDIKVLVLTQHDNKEYILTAIKAGAAGYLPKKALGSELLSAIRSVKQGHSFLYPTVASALIDDYVQKVEEKDPYDNLTGREREILKLIAEGYTSRKIAEMLFISLKTVHGHRTKIMEKLDIHNRTELIKFAMRKGLVSAEPTSP